MKAQTKNTLTRLQELADTYHNVDYQSTHMLGDKASAAAYIRAAIDIQLLLVEEYAKQSAQGRLTLKAMQDLVVWMIKQSRIEDPDAKVPHQAYEIVLRALQLRLPPAARTYFETVVDAYDFHDLAIEDNPFRI